MVSSLGKEGNEESAFIKWGKDSRGALEGYG